MPGPHTVVEEEPYPLRVEVRSGVLPPPGGELLEPLLGWPVPMAGRWSRRLRINVRFSRRGRRVLEPELLVIRDPLRLYSRELHGSGARRGARAAAGGAGDRARQRRRGRGCGRRARRGAEPVGRRLDASAAELEIDGLRAYREGAPASRIHWPSVARHGEMLERRLVAELDSAPLIVMDPSNPAERGGARHGGAGGGVAVRAGSRARTAARCCCRATGARSRSAMTSARGRRSTRGWRWSRRAPAPAGGVLGPRGGAVIWVTGADLRSTPRALERLPAGVALRGRARARSRASGRAVRGGGLHRLPGRARAARGGGGVSGLLGRTPAAAAAGGAAAPSAGAARALLRRSARLARDAARRLRRARAVRAPPTGPCWWRTPGRAHAARAARGHRRRRRARRCSAGRRSRGGAVHALAARRGLVDARAGPDGRGPARPPAAARPTGASSRDGLDRGLAGVQTVEWPYDGPDVGAAHDPARRARCSSRSRPLLAFWPARRGARRAAARRARRAAGPLRHGGDRARPGAPAAARARAAPPDRRLAVAAAPAAARGGRRAPWWLASGCSRCRWRRPRRRPRLVGLPRLELVRRTARSITFDWNHTLRAAQLVARGHDAAERQVRPAALLEGRDARRASTACAGSAAASRRQQLRRRGGLPGHRQPRAAGTTTSTTRAGTSGSVHGPLALEHMVVGAGITQTSTARAARADRRRHHAPAPARSRWREGDTYTVRAYVPDPTGARCAPRRTAIRRADRVHAIELPTAARRATTGSARRRRREHAARGRDACSAAAGRPRRPGRRRAGRDPALARTSACTTLAQSSRRASRPPTTPSRRRALPPAQLPLRARAQRAPPADGFLFEDKLGYCQQFSGAMALMLRMDGIPARVAAGFSPGLVQQGHAASTASATSTPTPGSRCGSPASAGCRSTPRRRAAPAQSQSSALRHERGRRRRGRGAPAPGRGGLGARGGRGRRTAIRRRERLARAAGSAAAARRRCVAGALLIGKSYAAPSCDSDRTSWRRSSSRSSGARSSGWAGTSRRRPRCWARAAARALGGSGVGGLCGGACARTATTRACRRARPGPSAARCAGSSRPRRPVRPAARPRGDSAAARPRPHLVETLRSAL